MTEVKYDERGCALVMDPLTCSVSVIHDPRARARLDFISDVIIREGRITQRSKRGKNA